MGRQIHFILSLALIISSSYAQCQDTISYVEAFGQGQANLYTSPARLTQKELIPIVGIATVGASLFFLDNDINEWFEDANQRYAQDEWVTSVTHAGDPITLCALPIVGWGMGKLTKNQKLTHTSEVTGLSLVHTGLITLAIKGLTGRGRPEDYERSDYWEGPSLKHWSFPSFHAAGSWAVATAIARSNPDKPLLGVICYTSATAVSLSRLYLNKHWSSDIFWGAALGFGVASATVKLHENTAFRFFPLFGRNQTGVGLTYRF